MNATITAVQFRSIQSIMEHYTGIHLGEHKRVMVESRLTSRLKATHSETFDEYLKVLMSQDHQDELDCFIDRLTTHETRFFRESVQYDQLAKLLVGYRRAKPFKVWSAACSTGEEAYSLAMVLEQQLGSSKWSVFGSDVSEVAIHHAVKCQYDMVLAEQIPADYRRQYCLKGVGTFQGTFTISQALRRYCHFACENLLTPKTESIFDAIFLRNVLIYFDVARQKTIIDNVIEHLSDGGYLFLGHSENVIKAHPKMKMVENCVYRKVAA
ncbi:protein-glutamate O-methyltransferase CheR [Vibrio tubiashii]|uniref:Chemotaxis protein methyltransferase n=1 Tax=Vibrio tubiashii TaxID=29498 RepID=A0AAE5GPK4_9VIBR|nr:protein-glutamate O-methyltransferase CheR [Vibrio tubiashii]NOI80660.1 protein-glutamate O-methyltransferase CheR [Vibrio tubiashii]